jgi:hypothetical protein
MNLQMSTFCFQCTGFSTSMRFQTDLNGAKLSGIREILQSVFVRGGQTLFRAKGDTRSHQSTPQASSRLQGSAVARGLRRDMMTLTPASKQNLSVNLLSLVPFGTDPVVITVLEFFVKMLNRVPLRTDLLFKPSSRLEYSLSCVPSSLSNKSNYLISVIKSDFLVYG